MKRLVILSSSLSSPNKLKSYLTKGGICIYAGEDSKRFEMFKDTLNKHINFIHPSKYHNFISKKRKDFVEWTEAVHSKYGHNLTHWITKTFSSNPYISKLFLYCMNLAWFKNVLNEYPDRDILFITESYATLKIAEDIASGYNEIKICKAGFLKEKIRFLYKILKNTLKAPVRLFTFAFRYLVTYFNHIKKENSEIQDVSVVIDTFLFENSFDENGNFNNRYLSNLYNYLNEKKISVAIFPVLHEIPLKKFRTILENIRRCKSRFILLENYLKVSDYIDLLFIPFRHLKHFERVPVFEGINVQGLIDEENWTEAFSFSYSLAVLMYKLPKRLRESGFSPKIYINWNENQTIHRAIISGFHRFLPKTEVVGAKPFVPPLNHLNLFNTDNERAFGFSPDRVISCGGKLSELYSQYDKNGQYYKGASFRYGYLWEIIKDNEKHSISQHQNKTIALFLPYSMTISKYMMNLVKKPIHKLINNGVRIIFKLHPTTKKEKIASLLDEAELSNKQVEIIIEDTKNIFPGLSAIITSASSIALEAICFGIPVVSIGMPVGLDFNMLDHMPSSMYKIVYTSDELDMTINKWALQHPLSFEERRKIGRQFLEQYFAPNTERMLQVYIKIMPLINK